MQIKLGEQLRELRRREGYTQEALAQALGVTAQAISRWEKNICYPDMELIPSIANFFGVSIDELFGYHDERAKKIDALADKLREMHRQNNGRDVCIDECIRLAREGLIEFPGNEKITLCLASALFNAGYVRRGENHLTDDEGYDIYDTRRHRKYPEWQEAMLLYEKLLTTLEEGELRQQAMCELIQLYANLGETQKAAALAGKAPALTCSREFLLLDTRDGRLRAQVHGEALLELVRACSELLIQCVIVNKSHLTPTEAARAVQSAIDLYDLVCTDGNFGLHHGRLVCLNLYLSEHLWRAGDHDGAFTALDAALDHARAYDAVCRRGEAAYTAPLLSTVVLKADNTWGDDFVAALPNDWPWWGVPGYADVEAQIKSDPRWADWVRRTKE